jgi:hypothetical protein
MKLHMYEYPVRSLDDLKRSQVGFP